MTESSIGVFDLPTIYDSGARHLIISQLNAQPITQQAWLSVQDLDTGMAYSIQQYQQLAKNIANQFSIEIQPAFINTITDASSFSNLTQALIKILPSNLMKALNDENIKDLSVSMVNEVRKRADDIEYQTTVLLNKANLFDASYNEFRDTYDTKLSELIKTAGDTVLIITDEIDEVSSAITQNINDVIKGAETLTEGVAKLGIGTLTKLNGIASEKDKKDDDASEISADFVVESIKLSAEGVSQSTTATKMFTVNLDKLAGLYQNLASTESTIAVAKVIQRQNNFFYESIELLKTDIKNLVINWRSVNSAFKALMSNIKALDSKQQLQKSIDGIEVSKREWVTLDDVINNAKSVFTS